MWVCFAHASKTFLQNKYICMECGLAKTFVQANFLGKVERFNGMVVRGPCCDVKTS